MTPSTDIAGTYEQHLFEQQEISFARWKASAYRNVILWEEWQSARDTLMKYKLSKLKL